jgi:creatinine amidohydrolase
MRFEDLSWMDVEKYLEQDDRLMLVLGACEQHAYLSLLTDIQIPLALADQAAKKTGVIIAPPLNFGISPYFLAYPGTLSLQVSTMIAIVEDLVRSAYGQGFRRMLILNGHGGNSAIRQQLAIINNDLPDLKLNWYDWWNSHSIEAIAQKYEIKPGHANWLEAFSFTIVNDMPDDKKLPPSIPRSILDANTARSVYGDGSFGGEYRVDETIMHEIMEAALQDLLVILRFE